MKSLRKEKGGYALLYVLVIVMVLVAISMMICTVALRNLQSQQAAVERMADKYAAQGEIEKIKAKIEAFSDTENITVFVDALDAFESEISALSDTATIVAECKNTREATITISSGENTKVSATLEMEFSIIENCDPPESGGGITGYTFEVKNTSFTSYAIETTGGDAG